MNAAPAQKYQESMNGNVHFRRATRDDVAAIVSLVNSAYRGPSSRAGWTTEADLLDGQRTDAEEISRLVEKNDSLILLCLCRSEIVGSVHLEKVDAISAYLGMLVIKPVLQGQGLGSRFMSEAEEIARIDWDVANMQIQVITLRYELIAYYQRRGYRNTGEIRLFPASNPKFGLPKVDGLMFEVLEKSLGMKAVLR